MNAANASGIGPLPLSADLRVDATCRRFEAAWRANEQPRLEDYLDQAEGPEQQALLRELLRLELDYRIRAGEVPTLDEYQSRFPHATGLIDWLLVAAATVSAGELGKERAHPARASRVGPHEPVDVGLLLGWPEVPGYVLESELGRGGMGVVYKARQVGLDRVVALKMILSGRDTSPEARLRFRREAEAAARLQHANIAQVYEVGQHTGLLFFSLEFCAGGSLADELKGTPTDPARAARQVRTLAGAMQAAHQASVIHRDLKPANVLFTADGTLKITDFGLAKKLDEDPSSGAGQGPAQTHTGVILGTPAYMAPEQARGMKEVGPPADIYALGAILYECLTGRPPFKAATAFDTICQVLAEEPVPPRRLNAKVPQDLETICLKCLQKDPARRYGSAADLADDLGRSLAGEPIKARPASPWERAVKWGRRRPTAAALVLTAAVALLATLTGLTSLALYWRQDSQLTRLLLHQTKRGAQIDSLLDQGKEGQAAGLLALKDGQTAQASQHFADAQSRLEQARAILDTEPDQVDAGLRDEIETLLGGVRAQRRQLTQQTQTRQQLQEGVEQLRVHRERLLFSSMNVVASEHGDNRRAILALAPVALRAFHLDRARSAQEAARALDRFLPFFGSDEPRRQLAGWCCEVLLIWAEAEADLAGGPEAEARPDRESLRQALRRLEQAEALRQAHGLQAMQILHRRRALYLSALKDEPAARAERDRAAAVTPSTPLDHLMLALDSYKRQDADQALRECALALRLQADDFWPQYLSALCHLRAGRWASADAWLTTCIGRQPGYFWPWVQRATARVELTNRLEGHARERQARGDVAGARQASLRADAQAREAQADLDEALALLPGGDRLAAYVVRMGRGRLAAVRRRWAEACDEYRKAQADQPPEVCHAHVQLAEAQRRLKNTGAALAELSGAIDRQPGAARLYQVRAQVHSDRGDRPLAQRDFEEALSRAGPKNREPWLAGVHVELGYLKHQAGRYDEALKDFAAALVVVKDYPDAHRQRAETLVALGRYAEAGAALDAYLKVEHDPPAVALQAHGLVCASVRDYPRAIESYNRALERHRDVKTLSYRGWAYLQTQALPLALADFQEVLKKQPRHPDALCGRGQVRMLLGEVGAAIEDAEAALAHGEPSGALLCGVACIYARAARQTGAAGRGGAAGGRGHYEARAVLLIEKALKLVEPAQRRQLWREQVLQDSALRAIVPSWLAKRMNDITP